MIYTQMDAVNVLFSCEYSKSTSRSSAVIGADKEPQFVSESPFLYNNNQQLCLCYA